MVPSKPSSVSIKLHLGFFDVSMVGANGKRASFRLPLRCVAADPRCKRILIGNLATTSVGLINSIALVGPMRRPTLTVDILA
jgi:hypothetical protein